MTRRQDNNCEDENRKSNLLLRAALLREQGDLDASSELFAEAAAIEERLAALADTQNEPANAIRAWYSAASSWAHAGDFHHSLRLLHELAKRPDLPASLASRIDSFSAKVNQHRERWRESVQDLASI